jgi:hypothetical protein
MSEPDRPLFNLEITEDATTGISIRLRHFGRAPNILAGISKDVLRKARPWVWSSYERRVLRKARSMSRQSYRLIRDTLVLERAKVVMAQMQHRGVARMSWLQRRRLQQARRDRVEALGPAERVTRNLVLSMKVHDPDNPALRRPPLRSPTLSEAMRDETGTALSSPRIPEPRDRSR